MRDCTICEKNDWKDVDAFRGVQAQIGGKKSPMMLCKNCGFVTYDIDQETLNEYYRNDYRNPSFGNVVTGARKINYHQAFLDPLFKMWKSLEKTKPVVCDTGAAMGIFLNWMQQNLPEGEYYGTEYTESMRKVAYYEYGLKLTEEFDTSKKYDLISSYKVAEHQLNVKEELLKYKECLTDDGYLYVSVPTWFGVMNSFGSNGFVLSSHDLRITSYYDIRHVNSWSRKLFETLLKKCGFQVCHEDHDAYDSTYLCKRNDELMKEEPAYEDVNQIVDCMSRIQKAWNFAEQGKFKEALDSYGNYPLAWKGLFEGNRAKIQNDIVTSGQDPVSYIEQNFILPCLEKTNRHWYAIEICADLYMKYDAFKKAADLLHEGLEKRHNNAVFLDMMAKTLRAAAEKSSDPEERHNLMMGSINHLKVLRTTDFAMRGQASDMCYNAEAQLPLP